MGITAAVVGVGVAVGTTVHQINQANKAKDEAKKIQKEQEARQAKLEDDAKRQLMNQEALADATQARDAARKTQRAKTSQGRAGTILTTPLGVQGDAGVGAGNAGGKTLLGS